MSVGGNGTEMKTWQEVKEMREKAARNGPETARLLSGGDEKKAEKESKNQETGKKRETANETITIEDDDVVAEAVQEV
ncbi:hypothetical protein EAH_00019810 [Eimeria acervulina]|uniref:Uncharacterized protein n=1 Tax=Eimeria acervulina TaxID=5801 RepID=U6GBU4_EIMAC|nr:hypothetical protein EAH_00019810 [Eimeria acervulina]CDI76818.1 hypothetical protein EAH_00019810 [Eimeria acervulina]